MVKTEGNRVIVSAKAKDAELEKGDDPNIKSRYFLCICLFGCVAFRFFSAVSNWHGVNPA